MPRAAVTTAVAAKVQAFHSVLLPPADGFGRSDFVCASSILPEKNDTKRMKVTKFFIFFLVRMSMGGLVGIAIGSNDQDT